MAEEEMDDETAAELAQEAQILEFLGKIFLSLPDEPFWQGIKDLDWAEVPVEGCQDIAAFVEERRDAPSADVVLELARDRARLVRGVGFEAIEPPYESLYTKGGQTNTSIGALNSFYSRSGYAVDKNVRDTSDQIGVELSFMGLMCLREASSLEAGDSEKASFYRKMRERFACQHLGRWKDAYAGEMERAATTGFYRGIAKMIGALPLPQ